MSSKPDQAPPWQIDRKVPVAVIAALGLAILVQSFGFGVWLANQEQRIVRNEEGDRRLSDRGDERFAGIRARLEMIERDRDRIIRVEEKLGFVGEAVRRIEAKLDQAR